MAIPLDLMLIRGTTVDARLIPRTEKDPPQLRTSPRSWLASQLSDEDDGVFYVLVPVALLLAGAGVLAFRWAVRDGQFDDVETPALRILLDDEPAPRSEVAAWLAEQLGLDLSGVAPAPPRGPPL